MTGAAIVGDVVLLEGRAGAGVSELSGVPCAGSGAVHFVVFGEATVGEEVVEDGFGHGAAADVAHADEEDAGLGHGESLEDGADSRSFAGPIGGFLRVFARLAQLNW